MKVVLATRNPGKLREMQALLSAVGFKLVSQADFELDQVEETGATFVENSILKARYVAQQTGLAAIADDSGLVVPVLNGDPGIYSARYAYAEVHGEPTDEQNNQKLIRELHAKNAFEHPVAAYFYCAMVFIQHANDPTPLVATAAWHGHIVEQPRGENGFGYDAYFQVGNGRKTSAELAAKEKNQASHRAQASQILLALLRETLSLS